MIFFISVSNIVLVVSEDNVALDMPVDDILVAFHDFADCIALPLSLDHRSNVQLLGRIAARFHEDAIDTAPRSATALQVAAYAIHAANLAAVENLVVLSENLVVETLWNVIAEA